MYRLDKQTRKRLTLSLYCRCRISNMTTPVAFATHSIWSHFQSLETKLCLTSNSLATSVIFHFFSNLTNSTALCKFLELMSGRHTENCKFVNWLFPVKLRFWITTVDTRQILFIQNILSVISHDKQFRQYKTSISTTRVNVSCTDANYPIFLPSILKLIRYSRP